MALTLAEGNKYSTTTLQKGVVELIYKDDPILERLPFVDIVGNSLTYNRETTMAGADFYDVGDTWVESTPVVTNYTATLKILGGDADVDAFLKQTRSNINDVKVEVVEGKTKAIRQAYLNELFYGPSGKGFDGLHVLIADTTYNTVHAGAGTGTALSMKILKQAIDMIKGFTPSLIVSSKAMRRGVETYFESIGSAFPSSRDEYGIPVRMFRDVPWAVSDYLVDTETAASGAYTAKTGGANTSIFILSFDPKGCCGVQNGGIQTDPIGKLETKDAERVRIKWYCGAMFQSLISCAKVDGIVAASAVTA